MRFPHPGQVTNGADPSCAIGAGLHRTPGTTREKEMSRKGFIISAVACGAGSLLLLFGTGSRDAGIYVSAAAAGFVSVSAAVQAIRGPKRC
jgi:hypothetical protein